MLPALYGAGKEKQVARVRPGAIRRQHAFTKAARGHIVDGGRLLVNSCAVMVVVAYGLDG